MRGYREHDFYCLNCGKKNMPIHRNVGRMKGKDHRKRLYCPWCKTEVNHIECRSDVEVEQFKRDFEEGLFEEEAAESIKFIKETELNFNV